MDILTERNLDGENRRITLLDWHDTLHDKPNKRIAETPASVTRPNVPVFFERRFQGAGFQRANGLEQHA